MSPLTGGKRVPSYLSCFAASTLYKSEPVKLYPKVVGVAELGSIRHRNDEVLQRKPVEPLFLKPAAVSAEGPFLFYNCIARMQWRPEPMHGA